MEDVERFDVVADISALRRGATQRLLEILDCLVEAAEAAQDGAAVGQVTGDARGIAGLAIELQRPIDGVERLAAPLLQPQQKAQAAQRVALQRAVAQPALTPIALRAAARRRRTADQRRRVA